MLVQQSVFPRSSSSAKADDPVFRDVSVQSQTPQRTGYPAFAEYDRVMLGGRISLTASAASAAYRARIPPPSSVACRRAAVRESEWRLACRQPSGGHRAT